MFKFYIFSLIEKETEKTSEITMSAFFQLFTFEESENLSDSDKSAIVMISFFDRIEESHYFIKVSTTYNIH
jgi:hypothetical protein